MKLIRVEYILDGSKVVFYYTADGQVDFRALVKDLASQLKTRIEMRQIGVRDARPSSLGGVGCCGLPCAATPGSKFYPVSIKVAKQQCLNLNPSRLSGVCGRLMCCLMYERTRAAAPARPPGAPPPMPPTTAKTAPQRRRDLDGKPAGRALLLNAGPKFNLSFRQLSPIFSQIEASSAGI